MNPASLIYVLEAAFGIGLAILIHELGHFLVAKRLGVRVERFSIGFGPKIFGFRKGSTEYVIAPILFGGYVKMAGEHPEERAGKPDEFFSKKPSERSLIVLAGVAMNAILSVALFTAAFGIGVEFISPEVGRVQLFGPAWKAGLKPGDKIVEIAGRRDVDFDDIVTLGVLAGREKGIPVKVLRSGEEVPLVIRPVYDRSLGFARMGFSPSYTTEVLGLLKGSAAEKAGIRPGDRILTVNGTPVEEWRQLEPIIKSSASRPLNLRVQRDGEVLSVVLEPEERAEFEIGVESTSRLLISQVIEGSPAEAAGLKAGDRVLSVNGEDVRSWEHFVRLVSGSAGRSLSLVVERKAETVEVEVIPVLDPSDGRGKIGVSPTLPPVIGLVEKGSPAEEAGLEAGDEIVRVGKQAISDWSGVNILAGHAPSDSPIRLTYRRNGETREVEIVPRKVPGSAYGFAGIEPKQKMSVRKYPVWKAATKGFEKALVWVGRIGLTFNAMLKRRVSPKTVSGPLGIAVYSYKLARLGLTKLLYFLGVINVFFAILNLLPIPILDGGLLLFLLIEKIKGSPVRERTMAIAQYLGFTLIIMILIYATFQDVMRFILWR